MVPAHEMASSHGAIGLAFLETNDLIRLDTLQSLTLALGPGDLDQVHQACVGQTEMEAKIVL